MSSEKLFNPGHVGELIPEVDVARQAVNSLGGYAYQALIATLAWLDLDSEHHLALEIAEDYALVAKQAIGAVQVKDTKKSGPVTLNSDSVRKAIVGFVDLVERNPDREVHLRFLTTSEIGRERVMADRPGSLPGLEYWRKVAAGADCGPLRRILESEKFPETVREFCRARDDDALRRDLIRRIDWDCGTADFKVARRDLEDRLIVLGRDRFELSSFDTRQVADSLVYTVLQKSIADAPEERLLTRGDLYEAMEAAALISIPRSLYTRLVNIALSLSEGLTGEASVEQPVADSGSSWLLDAPEPVVPDRMLARVVVERAVKDNLLNVGAAVVVGPSGSGKSILCRVIAASLVGDCRIVDFRGKSPDQARERVNALFARVGALQSCTLIVEDINFLDDEMVALGMKRVLDALRQRDCKALITCYRKPSVATLTRLGLGPDCVVECPYFSEEEVNLLVKMYGGDPDQWGRLPYFSGAHGHPQLTHAFVMGMETRGWPVEEIESTLMRGLTTDDTDAARETARRNLVSALSEGTRILLYRLSIVVGRFDRALGLSIGGIEPAIRGSGECLDQLIGPWIEAVGNDEYRVSPLASGFGGEMLEIAEQNRVHKAIAEHISKKRVIDDLDANAIMFHGLAGESTTSLAQLTQSLMRVDVDKLGNLAEGMPTLRLLRTDRLIYPKHLSVSVMLRMAQFRLTAALGDRRGAAEIVATLFDEASRMPDGKPKQVLDQMVLILLLSTKGVANYLDNWIVLLLRFKSMVQGDSFLQSLAANVESARDAAGAPYGAILFSIGSAELGSVSRLEMIVNDLDKIDPVDRKSWLTPIDKSLGDYSVLVNTPWVAEQSRDDFDASETALRFRRMSETTRSWGIRPLCLQCWVAQAIMLDEYLDDPEGALAVLGEAVTVMGNDLILSRARAKVHWRRGDHRRALDVLLSIADRVGRDSPVERMNALREAAISAANCNEWAQAEEWFLEAQNAAELMQIDDRQAIVIGLGADSSVAALEQGDVGQMLERLGEALVALRDIDPDATLRNTYCHRVVRHTALWAKSRILEEDIRIDGEPIAMQPGSCSNPEPLPEIRKLPLGHIDVSLYMLAQVEAAAAMDVGIRAGLQDRLEQGTIPIMEILLRLEEMRSHIGRLDSKGFSNCFLKYVESGAFLSAEVDELKTNLDPLAPVRGEIPALNKNGPFGPAAERVANEAILAFVVRCALTEKSGEVSKLQRLLVREFSGTFPGAGVFDAASGKGDKLGELERAVLSISYLLLKGEHLEPDAFWVAGLRLFEWVNKSRFESALMPYLAAWKRAGWERIVKSERFRLILPIRTVPEIQSVLHIGSNDRIFVAKLILASMSSVGRTLSQEYLDRLVALSRGEGQLSESS